MFSIVALAAFAPLFATLAAADNLGRPTAYSDGLSPHFVFAKKLPLVEQVSVENIDVPSQCTSYGQNKNGDGSAYCPSGQFTAQRVTFVDCSAGAFEFCQCNDDVGTRTTPMKHLVKLFSRMPPALKQNIRYILSMPSDGMWAETFVGPNDVLLFGPGHNKDGSVDVFIHETSHALDLGDGSSWNSSTTAWSDAVNKDSCVPDSYANSNLVEDFAQVSVVHTWTEMHGGKAPDSANDLSCLSNQLGYFASQQSLSMTADKECRADVKQHFSGYRRRSVPRRSLEKYSQVKDIPVVFVSSDYHGGKGHHPLSGN